MTFTHEYDPRYLEPVYDLDGAPLYPNPHGFGTAVAPVPSFTITYRPYLTPRQEIPPAFRSRERGPVDRRYPLRLTWPRYGHDQVVPLARQELARGSP